MSNENIDMLQDMIRDKLADDEVACDLIEDDEGLKTRMKVVSVNTSVCPLRETVSCASL